MKRIELSHRLTKSQGKFISVAICAVTGMMIFGSAAAAPKMVITTEHTATADSNNEINGEEGGGYFVESGKLNISNATVKNFTTKGGNGSGGGAGLGGAIFINNGAEVVLDNVNFSGNSAVGGDGGTSATGGALNDISKAPSGKLDGKNGDNAASDSAWFDGSNGSDGRKGYDGKNGGNGGSGGNGSDGSAVNADTIKAAADIVFDTATAIKDAAEAASNAAAASAAAAGIVTAALAPMFGAKAAAIAVYITADTVKAAADAAYLTAMTIEALEKGVAGGGGSGADGGNGGNGETFLGGGAGGAGGNAGDAYSHSNAVGGDGGNGGVGGVGGFGAGGGQGGTGGKEGSNGNGVSHNNGQGDGGDGGKGGLFAGSGGSGDGGNALTGGNGGSGLGGSIFVRAGGKLTIKGNASFDRGDVSGGSGDNHEDHQGEAGKEAGSDLFMMKGSTVVLDAGKGKTITFNGSIADDSAAGLDGASNASGKGADLTVKSGLVVFNGENTYTGQTKIEGGALHAEDGKGIHKNSNINFTGNHDGGVLETSGKFDRYTGTAKDRVQWTGSGGFAANGGDLEVSLNGGAQRTWGKEGFVSGDNALIFGSDTATDNVTFKNAINIAGGTATILVNPGQEAGKHAQMDGVISNGSLVVGDASHKGELILNAANTYAGGTTIKAGNLQLSDLASLNKDGAVIVEKEAQFDLTKTSDQAIGTLAGEGKVALAANTLTLNQGDNTTFSGVISGEKGNLIKQGTGNLTLSGDNTYQGQTQIKAGIVTLDGSLASQSVDISAGAVLIDNKGGLNGGLHQDAKLNNDGTLNLNTDDTVSSLTNTGTINGRDNTLTAKTYALNDGSTINANLGTGELTANGSVVLNGTSAAEKVNVVSGEMLLGSGERLDDNSDVTVDGKLILGGNETIGTLAGSKEDGALELSGNQLTLQQNKDTTFAGQLNDDLGDKANVLKQGTGTLTLTGKSEYLGKTTIEQGGITLDGTMEGTLASLDLDVQKKGTLTNNKGGLSKLAKLNNDGIVNQNSDDTIKTLVNTGTINASSDGKATLTADTYALNNGSVINANLGAGELSAQGNVLLNGTSAAGDVFVKNGVMTLGKAERLLNSSDVVVDGKLVMGGDETIGTLAGAASGVVELSGGKLALNQNHDTIFDGVIQDKEGDKGSLLKQGTGGITLNGDHTFSGNTTVDGGKMQLNGTLLSQTVHVKQGTLKLGSAERLLDSSDVTVDDTLIMGGNETIGTLAGSKAGGILELSGSQLTLQQNKDTTFAGQLNDAQVDQASVLKQGTGTLTLTGKSQYLGKTTIEQGGITLDGTPNDTLASLNLDVQKAGTLTNNQGGLSALAALNNDGVINQNSDDTIKTLVNTGTINASSDGKATLTANTYALNQGSVVHANLGTGIVTSNGQVALNGTSAAQTVNVNSGVMTLGAAERLLDSSDVTVNGKLVMGGDETIGTLAGAASGVVELSGSKLTLEQNHNTVFDGVIQDKDGDKGTLLKHGTGEITLNGDHTFSDDTTVDGGKVQLNGTLVSKTVHIKQGTMTLGAAERLLNTSDVTVDDTLIMGGNETIGTLAGTKAKAIVDLNGGKLTLLQDKDTLYAGQIDDASTSQGSVLKQGKGTLTLTGDSHYLGNTTIAQGGMTLDGKLASLNIDVQKAGTLTNNQGGLSALATLNNDGVVNQNSDNTIAALINTGTINASSDGKATLTAKTYALNDSSVVNANLGAGVLTSNGKVALNGTSTAQTVNVASGTLTLGSAERLLNTSDVSVDGKLIMGGNETIGTLAGQASGLLDLNGGKLTLLQNKDTLFAGQINDAQTGKGSVVIQGTGTITLTGVNHYIGDTRIENGGITLDGTLASLNISVQKNGKLTNNQGGLADLAQLNNDGIVNLNQNDTIAALSNTGTINASVDGKATLTAKTYALNGGSVINANLGSGSLIANGNVALNGTSAAESVKIDSGITTLGAADRLLDTAKLSIAGKLVLGGNETIAQLTGVGELDLNAGKLTLQQNTDSLFSGQISDASGKGSFVKQGSGMLSMTGDSSYKGATRIEQGAITLSGKLASQDIYIARPATLNDQNGGLSATAKLSNDGTLKIDANQKIASLSNSGNIIGNGTLSASNYALNDGSVVNANLGDGTLETHGKVMLNGTSAAENVHIYDQSALTLGAAERLNKNATVQIDKTGEMILAGGDQTIKTLNGSGTVNSTTHKLIVTNGGVFTGKINAVKTDLISTGGKLDISGGSNTQTDSINVQNNSQVAVGDTAVVTTGTATVDKGGVLSLNNSDSIKYEVLTGGGLVNTSTGSFTNSKKVQGFLSFNGDFRNEGTLAPGNSPGMITVLGNYTEAATLQSELQNTTAVSGHDQIRVAGKITLEKQSELIVQTYGGSAPRLGEVYQIMADLDGKAKKVSGHFATVKFDLDGVAGSGAAVVNAAAVFDVATGQVITTGLNLPQSTFADLGRNPNQRAAAAALMNIATSDVGTNQIDTASGTGKNAGEFLTANGATVADNAERLTPEYYGAISDYALLGKRSMLSLLQSRSNQEQNSAYAGYMRSGGQSAGNAHISRNDYYLGAEFSVNESLKLGSVLTVNSGKLEARFGSGNVNGQALTAYLAYQPVSDLNILASVAYAKYSYDLDRSGVTGQITGATTARGIDASLAASYKAYADQDFTLLARSSLSHGKVMSDAFDEQGSSHRLQLGSADASQLTGQLGASLIWGAKDQPLKLGADLGIERHFSDKRDDMQSKLAIDQRVAAPIQFVKDRDLTANIGFNASYKLSKDITLFGKVEYLNDKESTYSGQTGLNFGF
ncbi:autotransporter-associated beta strand repeat-containing protein [Iodobacter fluviatilis]|nr:autotransporter-associated beta strand repeat-containing protein [Iodobacter fluviatilis]